MHEYYDPENDDARTRPKPNRDFSVNFGFVAWLVRLRRRPPTIGQIILVWLFGVTCSWAVQRLFDAGWKTLWQHLEIVIRWR